MGDSGNFGANGHTKYINHNYFDLQNLQIITAFLAVEHVTALELVSSFIRFLLQYHFNFIWAFKSGKTFRIETDRIQFT